MEQKRRPFNDALAQRVIDMQVKEIDRLYQHLGEAVGRIETDGKLIALLEAEQAKLRAALTRLRDFSHWTITDVHAIAAVALEDK